MEHLILNPIVLLRTAYLSAALLVSLVSTIPELRKRFLQYGARASEPSATYSKQHEMRHTASVSKKQQSSYAVQCLDFAAGLTVPHAWFVSFYAVSVSCSLLWASALLSGGFTVQKLATKSSNQHGSMSFDQIVVAWIMLFAQGSRRLYECLTFSTGSSSRMWVGHWAIGILFYLATSMAIWIEGVETLRTHKLALQDFVLKGPSLRTFFSSMIFILASGFQHDCHAYLASLRNSKLSKGGKSVLVYQLPQHPAFNLCLTPHYLAECLIYLALTIQASPNGSLVNWTVACALVFVVVNLGTTANGTRAWYEAKFGAEAVRGRSRMIPLLY